jgi:hypothetical protein
MLAVLTEAYWGKERLENQNKIFRGKPLLGVLATAKMEPSTVSCSQRSYIAVWFILSTAQTVVITGVLTIFTVRRPQPLFL